MTRPPRGRVLRARTLRAALVASLGLAALLILSCGPRPPATEDPPDATINPLGPNAACYVCHMTFVREELSKTHLKAKVGCIKCHGLSAPHANDEDVGATKPDVVFKRPQIDPACRKCHPSHDVAPERVVALFQTRFPTKPPPAPLACTDCHGTHKIARER